MYIAQKDDILMDQQRAIEYFKQKFGSLYFFVVLRQRVQLLLIFNIKFEIVLSANAAGTF